jgi:hypothetical protein
VAIDPDGVGEPVDAAEFVDWGNGFETERAMGVGDGREDGVDELGAERAERLFWGGERELFAVVCERDVERFARALLGVSAGIFV